MMGWSIKIQRREMTGDPHVHNERWNIIPVTMKGEGGFPLKRLKQQPNMTIKSWKQLMNEMLCTLGVGGPSFSLNGGGLKENHS